MCLQGPSILVYPDSNKPYYLFTDASKYFWGTTACKYTSKSNSIDDLKPITFISSKFLYTQYNYAAFVRESFAIYDVR